MSRDLIFIDDYIKSNNLEYLAMDFFLEQKRSRSSNELNEKQKTKAQIQGAQALRVGILRKRLGLSLREFCLAVAVAPLYQWFCGINRFSSAEIFTKSYVNTLENTLSDKFLKDLNVESNRALFNKDSCQKMGFDEEFNLNNLYADPTCIKANIHYPVDWVLFRDLIRTSMLKVTLIRDAGINVRMSETPKEFISKINNLCIKMSMNYRTKDAKKKRKSTFREMVKLLNCVLGHAKSHMEKLSKNLGQANMSLVKAMDIIDTLEDLLRKAPDVILVARKRIISEKIILREEKILSIYENEVHIITRHKDGARSEFGNTMQLVEQRDGFIVDYDLLEEYSPGDSNLFIESLDRIAKNYGLSGVKSVCGDRGCDSKKVREKIEDLNEKFNVNILNTVAPRSSTELVEKLKDDEFSKHQGRRASTESRIATTKRICGNPMKQKGIRNRQVHLGWSVFSHNLFKAAKLNREQDRLKIEPPIAA